VTPDIVAVILGENASLLNSSAEQAGLCSEKMDGRVVGNGDDVSDGRRPSLFDLISVGTLVTDSFQLFVSPVAQPITEANMVELREAFQVFDLNNDGFISHDELSSAMRNFGHLVTKTELDEMIRLVDKDGNGLVDFKEFLELMDSNVVVKNVEQEMTNMFQFIDIDGDGFISEEEIKRMLNNMGEKKVKKKDIKRMMKIADYNKDGKISFNEFKRMISNGHMMLNNKSGP